jgi:hypothetical protein
VGGSTWRGPGSSPAHCWQERGAAGSSSCRRRLIGPSGSSSSHWQAGRQAGRQAGPLPDKQERCNQTHRVILDICLEGVVQLDGGVCTAASHVLPAAPGCRQGRVILAGAAGVDTRIISIVRLGRYPPAGGSGVWGRLGPGSCRPRQSEAHDGGWCRLRAPTLCLGRPWQRRTGCLLGLRHPQRLQSPGWWRQQQPSWLPTRGPRRWHLRSGVARLWTGETAAAAAPELGSRRRNCYSPSGAPCRVHLNPCSTLTWVRIVDHVDSAWAVVGLRLVLRPGPQAPLGLRVADLQSCRAVKRCDEAAQDKDRKAVPSEARSSSHSASRPLHCNATRGGAYNAAPPCPPLGGLRRPASPAAAIATATVSASSPAPPVRWMLAYLMK